MESDLTDEDWKNLADRAHAAACAEADRYGVNVFVEVFNDDATRYESRGVPVPVDAEVDILTARIADERDARMVALLGKARAAIEALAAAAYADPRMAQPRVEDAVLLLRRLVAERPRRPA
jgi:hypothetical protein